MLARLKLNPILGSEGLTRGLGDPEARVLVEWLVEQAESLAEKNLSEFRLEQEIHLLCLRGRAISRFVYLWCHERLASAAIQLAATERFPWPLPTTTEEDPCDLMARILDCEGNLD